MERGHRRGSARRPDADGNGVAGYNAGISLLSYIIGGILVWSLVGWWLDNLLGTQWIALAGALIGAAGGLYLAHVHHLTRTAPDEGTDGKRERDGEQGGN